MMLLGFVAGRGGLLGSWRVEGCFWLKDRWIGECSADVLGWIDPWNIARELFIAELCN